MAREALNADSKEEIELMNTAEAHVSDTHSVVTSTTAIDLEIHDPSSQQSEQSQASSAEVEMIMNAEIKRDDVCDTRSTKPVDHKTATVSGIDGCVEDSGTNSGRLHVEGEEEDEKQTEAETEKMTNQTQLDGSKELKALKFAFIQLSALKTLCSIVCNNKYTEMLLVPKAEVVADNSKSGLKLDDAQDTETKDAVSKQESKDTNVGRNKPEGPVHKDCEMIGVLRGVISSLVQKATMPCPFKRVVSLGELERMLTVLQKLVFMIRTEEEFGIKLTDGKNVTYYLIIRN